MFSHDAYDPCLLWTRVCSEAFKPEISCWQMLLNLEAYLGAGQCASLLILPRFLFSHFLLTPPSFPLPLPFLSWEHLSPCLSFYSPWNTVTVYYTPFGSHDFSVLRAVWCFRLHVEVAETEFSRSPRLGLDETETSAVSRPALGINYPDAESVMGWQINVSRDMPF